jgi:hypothetical protein
MGDFPMGLVNIPTVSVMPELRLLYASVIEVEEPILIGISGYGERRIIGIKGGTFSGLRLHGRVLPGGADWQVIRSDGITEIEARYTLETHDGARIYIENPGLRHGPKEVMERLVSGKEVDPKAYYFRTTPRFETGVEKYKWLNGIIAVAVGERRAQQVLITVYELT